MGQTIQLQTSDGVAESAYRADPEGAPVGGVVVIQEIFGVNAHIRSVADRFAAEGFLAVAPALFDRVEPGVELGYEGDDLQRGVGIAFRQLDHAAALDDIRAAARVAGEAGPVAVVGFCFGGLLAARTALDPGEGIAAAVGYYGGGTPALAGQGRPRIPLLLHYGANDAHIPLDQVRALAEAWPDAEVHVYDDADHGFNCDVRASHHAESAALAMERTLSFLRRHLR